MRDEDLKNLPQSIEGWRIGEMLAGIGVKYSDVASMAIWPQSVEIEVYATDESGHRYRTLEKAEAVQMDGSVDVVDVLGDAARHSISIPIVGPWEKPAEDPQTADAGMNDPDPDAPRCNAQKRPGDGTTPVCDRARGHAGCHVTGGITWP